MHRLVKYFVSNHLLIGNRMNQQQVATMFEKTGQALYFCTLVQNPRSHIHSAAMLSAVGLARKMRQRLARTIWLCLLRLVLHTLRSPGWDSRTRWYDEIHRIKTPGYYDLSRETTSSTSAIDVGEADYETMSGGRQSAIAPGEGWKAVVNQCGDGEFLAPWSVTNVFN